MMTNPIAPTQKLLISRWLTILCASAVIVLLLNRDGSWIAKSLLCTPFLFVAPGLVLQWYRSYSWLSLMILAYFIVAVTDAMAPNGMWVDTLFVALTVIVFFSSTMTSRWLQQQQFVTQPKQTASTATKTTNSDHSNFSKDTP